MRRSPRLSSCFLTTLSLVLVSNCALPVLANDGLTSLENPFFEQTDPRDSNKARLTRLEKMIFDEAQSGSTVDRLSVLRQAINDNQNGSYNGYRRGYTGY